MGKKIRNITWETPDYVIESTPVSELSKEILDYYMEHDYGKRGIPLSVKTVKEIAKILDKEAESWLKQKSLKPQRNMTRTGNLSKRLRERKRRKMMKQNLM